MQDFNFQMQFISAMAFLAEMDANAGNLTEKLGVSPETVKTLQEFGAEIYQSIEDMPDETFKQHFKTYLESLAFQILVAKEQHELD